MTTNSQIASAILSSAISDQADFRIELCDNDHTPYEGAVLLIEETADSGESFTGYKMVHVYLCDDDGQSVWMLDATDAMTGDVNPLPLTAEKLDAAIAWVIAPNSAPFAA